MAPRHPRLHRARHPSPAQKTVLRIQRKAQVLKRFPEAGHRYEHQGGRDVRNFLYGHYRIAYLVKGGESIDILGVFHGALEIERYLF